MEPANIIICHLIGANLAVSTVKEEYWPPAWHANEDIPLADMLKNLCKDYTNLDFKWLDPKLIDVVKNESGGVDIIYGALLPPETTIKDKGFWAKHNIDSKLLRRIMKEYA